MKFVSGKPETYSKRDETHGFGETKPHFYWGKNSKMWVWTLWGRIIEVEEVITLHDFVMYLDRHSNPCQQ